MEAVMSKPLEDVFSAIGDLWHSTGDMRQAVDAGKCIKCAWHDAEEGSHFCEFCVTDLAEKGARLAKNAAAEKTGLVAKRLLQEFLSGGFRPPGAKR